MDNYISLEDDNSPSVGNNLTVGNNPIDGGSVSIRGKRLMGKKSANELLRKSETVQVEVHKYNILFETFNQYLIEKEMEKAEREEKRIQALQEMKEFEIRRQEHEIKKEEHLIMTTNSSHLDP